MRIFMYSDLHISKTSSILPLTDTKYSYRQDMIMRTGKWLSDIVAKENPDLIINLGDTFDQHTVTSYDIDTASEFFRCFSPFKILHLVLVGNHEMVNQDFNAVSILNNIDNITVIDRPIKQHLVFNNEELDLAFLPYCNFKELRELPKGNFLFSHMDIQGSVIRQNIELQDGLTNEQLNQYKLVFNGHIHKPSIKNNVINVGSITTHSFSDDEESVPTCYIFDTKTLNLQQFRSSISPLFRKITINNMDELINRLNSLDDKYLYCIHCVCPFEIKDLVREVLEENDKVISSRLNVKITGTDLNEDEEISDLNIQTNIDISRAFKSFLQESLENKIDLKYPTKYYQKVLENL